MIFDPEINRLSPATEANPFRDFDKLEPGLALRTPAEWGERLCRYQHSHVLLAAPRDYEVAWEVPAANGGPGRPGGGLFTHALLNALDISWLCTNE
jgi:hypothetical protein